MKRFVHVAATANRVRIVFVLYEMRKRQTVFLNKSETPKTVITYKNIAFHPKL